ncbi:MAG: helix-turn-helix domain-containing protein [Oscillospiraceae bacterium]
MSINSNLRLLREASGLTQEQVAEKIGITRQALSSYESGRTRPDIDMLLRLADVYNTDLDNILYGREPALKALRRFRRAALIFGGLLILLTLVSSALLWSAHVFFPIADGQIISQSQRPLLEAHFRLAGAWETMDTIILSLTRFGFIILIIWRLIAKCRIPYKHRLIYTAALAAGIMLATFPFAFTDPVFTPINYFITPFFVICRIVIFVAVDFALEYIQIKRMRSFGLII